MNQREAVERVHLVFLRLCHNSPCLSEDIDFIASLIR